MHSGKNSSACDCGCFGHGAVTVDAHTHSLTGSVNLANAEVTPTIPVPDQVAVALGGLGVKIACLESELEALTARLHPVLVPAERVPEAKEEGPVLLSPVAYEIWRAEQHLDVLIGRVISLKNLLTV